MKDVISKAKEDFAADKRSCFSTLHTEEVIILHF